MLNKPTEISTKSGAVLIQPPPEFQLLKSFKKEIERLHSKIRNLENKVNELEHKLGELKNES